MADTLALLEYLFLFDPTYTWQHLGQFEADLAEFFKSKGYEANIIPTVNPDSSRRLLMITHIDVLDEMRTDNKPHPEQQEPPPREIPKPTQTVTTQLTPKKQFDKYRK